VIRRGLDVATRSGKVRRVNPMVVRQGGHHPPPVEGVVADPVQQHQGRPIPRRQVTGEHPLDLDLSLLDFHLCLPWSLLFILVVLGVFGGQEAPLQQPSDRPATEEYVDPSKASHTYPWGNGAKSAEEALLVSLCTGVRGRGILRTSR
jgi:hypothetical protein